MSKGKWIWLYGDYEIYHSLHMQTRRQEYDYMFPPFWKIDDCNHNVKFRKTAILEKPENITIHAHGIGMIEIFHKSERRRVALGKEFSLCEGENQIIVYVANTSGLPSIFSDSCAFATDESWQASDYSGSWSAVGCSDKYSSPADNPQEFGFCYEEIEPVSVLKTDNGLFYDFGRETFAKLEFKNLDGNIKVCYGESKSEALDEANCYLYQSICKDCTAPARAFRYLNIIGDAKYELKAFYEYLPLDKKGSFHSSDGELNRIWETAEYTFHLNSREFFLDGIKRDRWVWSGDAYQSHFINRYLFFDEDISKRTIIALGGNSQIRSHINTITDYSLYWIMSIYDYYEMTKDIDFIKRMYQRLENLFEFCISRLDENGFIVGKDGDWVFIDWADIDKTGAVCAEQMLLLMAYRTMAICSELVGKDGNKYRLAEQSLIKNVNKFFWDSEQGAYIDSFSSGKMHVSRHANIFALLFGYANDEQRESIIKNVLLNDNIPKIKTPYFKFYELEALCNIGMLDTVTKSMKEYWGGMLQNDATSFWEEYNPDIKGDEQYKMYADKFGKSLCHAWGASPVYLIGRFYLGVRPTSAGYETFEVKPHLGGLDFIDGTVPINGGTVTVKMDRNSVSVHADKDGGELIYNGKRYAIEKNKPLTVLNANINV